MFFTGNYLYDDFTRNDLFSTRGLQKIERCWGLFDIISHVSFILDRQELLLFLHSKVTGSLCICTDQHQYDSNLTVGLLLCAACIQW